MVLQAEFLIDLLSFTGYSILLNACLTLVCNLCLLKAEVEMFFSHSVKMTVQQLKYCIYSWKCEKINLNGILLCHFTKHLPLPKSFYL